MRMQGLSVIRDLVTRAEGRGTPWYVSASQVPVGKGAGGFCKHGYSTLKGSLNWCLRILLEAVDQLLQRQRKYVARNTRIAH